MAGGNFNRTALATESQVILPIPFDKWRVFDALATNLPGTAADDDLGLIGGVHGTASPSIQTSDAKADTVTQKARCVLHLPPEYVDAGVITLRAHAGMKTTVSDTTATLDFAVFESDDEEGVGSDLVTTAAQSINSLTLADKDFTITPTGVITGDTIDILMTIAIVDSATGTAVLGLVGAVDLLLDLKG